MATSNDTIWFCATGRSGLGHLRRCATIAGAIRRLAPDQRMGLITNAPASGSEAIDQAAFSEIEVRERAAMAARLAERSRGPVVIDTAVVPGISALRNPLALILRETPQARVKRFELGSGRPWDLTLVPNPEAHWLPQVGESFARAIVPVGWIYREPPGARRPPRRVPCVLVATGGGGTAEAAAELRAEIDAVIGLARARSARPFVVLQAIGPLAAPESRLRQADQAFSPGDALDREFALADLVISTAGYNSVLELALTDTPALLVPIPRTIDDQAARAQLWGPRLGACHDPAEREASAAWIARCLEEGASRVPCKLGPSGCAAAARQILGLSS